MPQAVRAGDMQPRFLARLGLADAVTVGNAAVGFLAAAVAAADPSLAARLVLLAAIADGLDGVLARRFGSSDAGAYLDSLADVASFGVAPALIAVALVRSGAAETGAGAPPDPRTAAALAGAALFVAAAVVRLGLYTAYDAGEEGTEGVQTTLAATVLAAGVLADLADPIAVVALAVLLAALMVTPIAYPDLHWQDALVMGAVQALAVVLPGRVGEAFAFGILFLALAYLALGPRFYWRQSFSGT